MCIYIYIYIDICIYMNYIPASVERRARREVEEGRWQWREVEGVRENTLAITYSNSYSHNDQFQTRSGGGEREGMKRSRPGEAAQTVCMRAAETGRITQTSKRRSPCSAMHQIPHRLCQSCPEYVEEWGSSSWYEISLASRFQEYSC